MRSKYLLLLTSVLAASPALAQEDEVYSVANRQPATAITVVATGSKTLIADTGQSVSVIDHSEIQAVQGPDLTRVLERLPGVTFSRNGDLGAFTGVRVRGADAEQVLVLLDGVRINDPGAPGGGYDFGSLLAGGIERVDLLRGSNSVVWGSQAIGGVIALTSRKLDGIEGGVEYGARDSVTADAATGIAREGYDISLNGGYSRTDGISASAAGTEPDGFRQWRIGGRGSAVLSGPLSATFAARYADSKLEIDGFGGPPDYAFIDTPEYQTAREASGRAGLTYASYPLALDAGFAISDTRREYFDAPGAAGPNYATKGRSERADLSGSYQFGSGVRLDFGADSEWTHFSTLFDPEVDARLSSGHALLGYDAGRFDIAAGVRYDDHSRFGGEWTFGANGSVGLVDSLRLRASYGEGFKVPTLFQLYSNFGNQALVPEQSRSYDAALEWGDRNQRFHAALTLFRRDSRDLIDFVSCFGVTTGICTNRPFGTYDNVARARAEGFEAELGAKLSERFTAQAAYTYVKATNRTAGDFREGNDLARRPRHALTVSADWDSPWGLALGADLRLVGDSFDDSFNSARLDGYELVTLRASLPVTSQVELYGRIENLFDVDYATAAGYGTPGRSAFVGVRGRF